MLHNLGIRKEEIISMQERISIMDRWDDNDGSGANQPLGVVKFDASQIAVVPFSNDVEFVQLHFCESPELRSYVQCNTPCCVLCRAGRKADERALLPVYLPAVGAVGVLPISPSIRPGSLRPQVMPILKSGPRVVMLISRADNVKFDVSTVNLTEDMDDGAAVIKRFMDRWEAGEVKLSSVYPRFDNRTLAELPGIAAILKIKGVKLDEHGDPR
jgi:hypothetical protein